MRFGGAKFWLVLLAAAGIGVVAGVGIDVGTAQEGDDGTRLFTFSWPFEPDAEMRPRGGTTRGTQVELRDEPTPEWKALQEPGLSKFERDRRAILAMAGGYRTTFDFLETVGFTADYEPARPYQSWSTEHVYVIEDSGDFISLQHILVMYFVDDAGEVRGPIVQKHWRQDWRYEDRDLRVYLGDNRWRHRRLDADAVRGEWSQAVFQVDDSPRYEASGEWVHKGNYSAWTSGETWRPLPRREWTVRDDYDVLIGTNRITITPRGWVQEEDNLKVVLAGAGERADDTPVLARELGVNRYERTADFDFSAGAAYWEQTAPFWRDVRAGWSEIYAENGRFRIVEERNGVALFQRMFEYAARLESGEGYDAAQSRQFVQRTLDAYVR